MFILVLIELCITVCGQGRQYVIFLNGGFPFIQCSPIQQTESFFNLFTLVQLNIHVL